VRRGEEEEEVDLSKFLRFDRSVFKVVGGSNALGLAPNLVSTFLTLSTSIGLHSLGFGSKVFRFESSFVSSDFYSFITKQFWETNILGRQTVFD
jgi:hypothetical protein